MIRSFQHQEFRVEALVEAKRGRTVSVCIPARDEEATVGRIVDVIRTQLMDAAPLVDEVVVIDDRSGDRTAEVAAGAGAQVVNSEDILVEYPDLAGKGQAMWRGVHVAGGDLIAFVDADITNFGPEFVSGIVGPLLVRDDISLVKAFYRRPLNGRPDEGGRVTELVARPLVSMLFPHLAPLLQPLAGEYAARREVLEQVPFVCGYGVDLGLCIDIAAAFGPSSIVQCDLGERVHRNRPLSELSAQAMAIMQLALNRAGFDACDATDRSDAGIAAPLRWAGGGWSSVLQRPGGTDLVVTHSERPPLAQVPAYRRTA